jgi:hypothetical protein
MPVRDGLVHPIEVRIEAPQTPNAPAASYRVGQRQSLSRSLARAPPIRKEQRPGRPYSVAL